MSHSEFRNSSSTIRRIIMTAGSINPVARPVTQAPPVKAAVERTGERENDRDRDDKVGSAPVSATAKPTVNTNGQLVGSKISVKA
jgi:hypothetical protein